MSRRIIFLDFDGVLHPSACEVDKLFSHLHLLEDWLRTRHDVCVVISSSWRALHSIDEIRSYFSCDLESRVLGATPVFNARPTPPDERHQEILQWLHLRPGQVHRWAILDDQPERFPAGLPELVAVDGRVGLTVSDLRRADQILNLLPTEES